MDDDILISEINKYPLLQTHVKCFIQLLKDHSLPKFMSFEFSQDPNTMMFIWKHHNFFVFVFIEEVCPIFTIFSCCENGLEEYEFNLNETDKLVQLLINILNNFLLSPNESDTIH